MSKTFTMADVAAHNKAGDIWMVIDGAVYDLSKFAKLHPGGERILLNFAGKDATTAFWELHRGDVLDKYSARLRIGVIEGHAVPKPRDLGLPSPVPYASPMAYQGFQSPYLTQKHLDFQQHARRWFAEHIRPDCETLEKQGKIPGEPLRRKLAATGVLATLVSHHGEILNHLKEIGLEGTILGLKPDEFDTFCGIILLQEAVRIGSQGLIDGLIGGSSIGLPPVAMFARKEVKERVVREVVTGEKTIALAVSEPYAGSDVANLTCTAKKSSCGRYFIVNGEKKWITGGMQADYFSTAVRTGGKGWNGVSMLLIPRGEGVVTKQIPTAYSPSAGTAYVMFTDVKVPVENLIGKMNMGVVAIASNFNQERFGMCVMINERCRIMIDECFRWAINRKIFGKRLINQPVVRQKIAEMSAAVESMAHWIDAISYQYHVMPEGERMRKLGGPIALLKYHSTRVSIKIADNAAQIMGGRGLTRGGMGYKVQEFVRDIKFSAILGGAEEVMADFAMRDAQKKIPTGARL